MPDTGKIHVYYGHGKGKTTAAIGQAVRAAGSGLKVLFVQFLKDNSSGERNVLEKVSNITCFQGKDKITFVSRMDSREKDLLRKENKEIMDEAGKVCDSFDMLVLDEVLCAVWLKVLDEDILLQFLKQKKESVEIVLTGHEVTEKVLEIADYATEIRKIKHPFDKGLRARKGIEY